MLFGLLLILFEVFVSIKLIIAIGLEHPFTIMFVLSTMITAACTYDEYQKWKEEK